MNESETVHPWREKRGRRLTQWATSVVAVAFGIGLSIARADAARGFWNDYLSRAEGCVGVLNDEVSDGARCLLGNGLKLVLNESLHIADALGKRSFGQHFQVTGKLTPASVSSEFGIEGDVDMVLPFAGSPISVGRPDETSFFFQHGVTRSWDPSGSGLFRNDVRHGVVTRFRISDAPGSDIFGISTFHLFNAERGHRVVAPGFDYTGKWGKGSFRYFIPTSGWRPGGSGHEERALEGIELGVRFDMTTTVRLNMTGYRWRAEDGSNRWDTGARVNLDWRPHRWFEMGVGYSGIGGGADSTNIQVALKVPFGTSEVRPPWEGLGAAAGGAAPPVDELWRPIQDLGPIKVATRMSVSALVREARVKFLQDVVGSGDTVQLEVWLPGAAPEDIRLLVHLVAGDGPNPAVAKEDFVDAPVETIVRKGTVRSIVSIKLLMNDSMEAPRSLSATVSMAS